MVSFNSMGINEFFYQHENKQLKVQSVLWNANLFDFCRSVAYRGMYQIEKQRLCKSINGRFLTDCCKMKSNYNIEKLKKTTSKTTKMSNSQLTLRFNNFTF
jgi:hypothetical protein